MKKAIKAAATHADVDQRTSKASFYRDDEEYKTTGVTYWDPVTGEEHNFESALQWHVLEHGHVNIPVYDLHLLAWIVEKCHMFADNCREYTNNSPRMDGESRYALSLIARHATDEGRFLVSAFYRTTYNGLIKKCNEVTEKCIKGDLSHDEYNKFAEEVGEDLAYYVTHEATLEMQEKRKEKSKDDEEEEDEP